jgi:excisionase family DNA binding protein
MENGLNLDAILDALAERIAVKVRAELAGDGAATVKPRLFTVEQAAAYLGRTKEGMQHLLAASKIPAVRADRRVYLDVRDLDRWIEQNKA